MRNISRVPCIHENKPGYIIYFDDGEVLSYISEESFKKLAQEYDTYEKKKVNAEYLLSIRFHNPLDKE
jgi:hypothetical protein